MPLQAGTRLGPYEIVAPLGAGGMGEVYKARDTRLDRTVAIKILPAMFAADPQFRDRFDREARALSGLDHPNICPLYDVGQYDGTSYLVMPLIPGESLAARLQRGPLPLEEALAVAIGIADALARAHRAGIVHRDLKPANIMLTKTGAKLLDFGLAKQGVDVVASSSGSIATVQNLTAQGSILGTLQYMAPEQLEGGEADARSDIFAFGTLLYEMVTGRRAFEAKSHASLIAAILEREPPPVSQVQPVAPPALDRIVRKCLAKDPDSRWQSAADLADELRWIANPLHTTSVAKPGRSVHSVWPWLVAMMAIVLLIATIGLARRGAFAPAAAESRALMSIYPLPADLHFFGPSSALGRFAPSPDGRMIVFQAVDASGTPRLWLRRLDSLDATPIPGTDRGVGAFWSPDSRFIAFAANGQLKRVDLASGVPTVLAESTTVIRGAWGPDGTILFNRERTGPLYRIPAAGGAAVEAARLPPGSGPAWQNTPSFLPDGRHFVFAAARQNLPGGIYVGSLDGGEAKLLLSGIPNAAYSQGYLLFVRDSALVAQPFDASRLELTGQAATVVEDLEIGLARTGAFAVSESGLLVFQHAPTHGSQSQLEWVNRNGGVEAKIGEPADQIALSMSPDGTKAAASLLDPVRHTRDIWTYDLKRGGVATRLTSDPGDEMHSVWSADGSTIIYAALHEGVLDLYKRASNGTGRVEPILEGLAWNKYPTSWSRDGSSLLFFNGFAGSRTSTDVWLLPLATRTPEAIVKSEFAERAGRFSWDGRWIAYESDESGHAEIYVMPFRVNGGKVRVSTGGGVEVCWRSDDRELYYVNPDDRVIAVDVDGSGSTFAVGGSRPIFATRGPAPAYNGLYPGVRYQAAADGQHFLVSTPLATGDRSPITLVTNWPALLSRR